MVLNESGLILESVISSLEDRFDNILIEQYCIMPNHVHMIITILDDSSTNHVGAVHEPPVQNNEIAGKTLRGQHSLLSNIIGYLKMNSAKQIRLKNPIISIVWQRGFNDHIIRNEEEHRKIEYYVRTNAQRWKNDILYTDENV